MMKNYPIGIQDFGKLRRGNYLYVDKTKAAFNLIRKGNYYFLSRPRRFGKSLLLSTLKYIFKGEKQLFEDLWIDSSDYSWEKHLVIHFSFSTLGYQSIGLEKALLQMLDLYAEEYDVSLTFHGLGPRFSQLIQKLSVKKGKVVVLIDEYDKPLIDYITQKEKAEENRQILRSFYAVVKDADPYLRFFLITGVSKFSKVSIFSDLNHLLDITMLPEFETATGYTQAELEHYFKEEIDQLAVKENTTREAVLTDIKRWYNGYTWSLKEKLYNPFSILSFMVSGIFQNFWWETGSPSFLINLLRDGFEYDIDNLEAGTALFESYTLENLDWRSLCFQTGYLTLKDFDPEFRVYTLGYPNREVKDAMFQHLLASYRNNKPTETSPLYAGIKRSLDKKDIPRFIELLNALLSTIPHQIFIEKKEAFFHAVLHLTFQGLGMYTQSEVNRSKGRVDIVIHSNNHVYVIECKLDGSAESAMHQIREKQYGHASLGQGKPVIVMGINFSSETRMVEDWILEDY